MWLTLPKQVCFEHYFVLNNFILHNTVQKFLVKSPRALVEVFDFATVYKGEWLNDQV